MLLRRLALILAVLLTALAATAATVEDRSAFRQGHWWDPTRSGHGFEILSNNGQVFVVWYTYDEAGLPTWYTAQATESSMGTIWPLQKHRWANGRIAESATVGILQMTVKHFEKITVSWQVGGGQGTWTIEPFVQSGVINEVDLTGHWYSPANSGWGMTLLDQGDVFGAVIYAYDPNGEPTWVAGFDRGKGTRIALHSARGPCPRCAPIAVGSNPAGSIDIGYRGDSEVTVRGAPAVSLAPGIVIDGAQMRQLGRPASGRSIDFKLASFARKQTLKAYLDAGMERRQLGSMVAAGSDFSASPPQGPASHSLTNTQEAEVDEADVVKSDGDYIYSLTNQYAVVIGATTAGYTQKVRIAHVAGGTKLEPAGEAPLFRKSLLPYVDSGLYLHAGNLVTTASNYYYGGWYYGAPTAAQTNVEIRSLANPTEPASRWQATISGSLISSRRVGNRIFLVTRFSPSTPSGFVNYPTTDAQRQANAALLASLPVEQMLPTLTVEGSAPVPLVDAASVYVPQFGGKPVKADMIVVTVLDIAEARVTDSLAIVGQSDILYASPSNLYLAFNRYDYDYRQQASPTASASVTDIHQIRTVGDRLEFVGSATIEGFVGWGERAPFRFGEHAGRLSVVSSLDQLWGGGRTNHRLTLLEPSTSVPGLLKTVSWLPNTVRPEPIGKTNEGIFGIRHAGNKLYVVTFPLATVGVDPLYIIDLSDKADPRITGELEVPGFSDYLHPLPNGMLLGFGRDGTQGGVGRGLQLSLYDVSGAAPREVQRVPIASDAGWTSSALFNSHHAFSSLIQSDGSMLIAFPATASGTSASYFSGLMRFRIDGALSQGSRLVELQRLQTYPYLDYDSALGRGRSVLFPGASVYIGSDKFWRLDHATGATSGPH